MLRSLSTVAKVGVRGFCRSTAVAAEQPTKKEVEELFSEKPQEKRLHAYSRNRVEIVGGVAADPVYKIGKNDRPFSIVNVITNHPYKSQSGETLYRTERHSISVFGPKAKTVSETIKKGQRVLVEGRLAYSGGELLENGERTPKQTHIHADSIQPFAKNQN